MALIGNQTISHQVLRVGGGGQSPTFIEGGSDHWIVEPASPTPQQVYNTVVEALAWQGYRLVAVEGGVTTLQLEPDQSREDAGTTSLYIVERALVSGQRGQSLPQQVSLQSASQTDQALLASCGLNGLRPEQASSIVSLVRTGQIIQAIKAIREAQPSLGLKEAKDIADNLRAALGISHPASGSGCAGTAVLAVLAIALATSYLLRL